MHCNLKKKRFQSATWFVLFERANKYEMRHSLFWFISYSPSQRNCLQAALLILHMNKMWKHKKIQKPFFVVILIKACIFLPTLSIFIQVSPFVWCHDQTSSIYLIRSDRGNSYLIDKVDWFWIFLRVTRWPCLSKRFHKTYPKQWPELSGVKDLINFAFLSSSL